MDAAIRADPSYGSPYLMRAILRMFDIFPQQAVLQFTEWQGSKAARITFDRSACEPIASDLRVFESKSTREEDVAAARGLLALLEGRVDDAKRQIDIALTLRDESSFRVIRSLLHFANNDLTEAEKEVRAAIALAPRSPQHYVLLGTYLNLSGRPQNAIDAYGEAIRRNKHLLVAYLARGAAWIELRRLDDAIRDFDECLALEPNQWVARLCRSRARRIKGDLDGALIDCEQVLKERPNDPEAFLCRGNVYLEMQKHAEAVSDYSKALSSLPHLGVIHFNRALARLGMSEYREAIGDLRAALEKGLDVPDVHDRLGFAHSMVGEFERAIDAYTQAIRRNPRFAQALAARGGLYYQNRRYQESLTDLEAAVELDPHLRDQLAPLIEGCRRRLNEH